MGAIRERRKAREEKERFERLGGKLHARILERRLRRRNGGKGGKDKDKDKLGRGTGKG